MKRLPPSIAVLIFLSPTPSVSATFVVTPGGDNQVVFVSKAAMEKFEGKTSRLAGRIEVDPDRLGDSAQVHFEVDLAALDTGIARRNQHMRDNHLETSRFPKAVFDGVAVVGSSAAALRPGVPTTLDVEGTFMLHGVSRRMRVRVETTYTTGSGAPRIAFRARFPVRLGDHAISRPQFLFLKLADTQEVLVRGIAVAGGS